MKKEGWGYALGMAGKYIGIGWVFAILIVVGIMGGAWADGRMRTYPVFMFLGLVVALSAIAFIIYRINSDTKRE